MKYKIEELQFKTGQPIEQERTRAIFEDLRNSIKEGIELSVHEKRFFCNGLVFSIRNDGTWEDYPEVCDCTKFKSLYLTYFLDFTGGSKYIKADNGVKREVSIPEAQTDLKYMDTKFEEWTIVIEKTNHSSSLLQQASKETRENLKELKNQPEFKNNPISQGTRKFHFKKMNLVLHAKYMYHLAQEILEEYAERPPLLNIGNESFVIDEFSLIHILHRHYSQITKQYDTNKSFHTEDLLPKLLGKNLESIFARISENLPSNFDYDKLVIKFKGQKYMIWSSIAQKGIKGKGNVCFRRLNTFYPLEDAIELQKINSDYRFEVIDEELELGIHDCS